MRAPSSPCRVAVLALLLWSPVVVAQAPVARVRREQQLVLSERPAGMELELRLATGVTTKGVGPGREVRMDVAARFLLLQPREVLPRVSGRRWRWCSRRARPVSRCAFRSSHTPPRWTPRWRWSCARA